MKTISKTGNLCLAVAFSLILVACEENCKETLFQIKQTSLSPRTLDDSGKANSLWLNSAGMPIDRLVVKIDLEKPVQVFFTANPKCPTIFQNNNPVTSLEFISSEEFDADYPAGADLSALISYTDLTQTLGKEAFVREVLNKSNTAAFFFKFDRSPDQMRTHTITMNLKFRDGTSLVSSPILVSLAP